MSDFSFYFKLSADVSEDCPASMLSSFGGVEQLCKDLHGLLGSAQFSDVVMVTMNGTHIPSHAAILSSRCPGLTEVCTCVCGLSVQDEL